MQMLRDFSYTSEYNTFHVGSLVAGWCSLRVSNQLRLSIGISSVGLHIRAQSRKQMDKAVTFERIVRSPPPKLLRGCMTCRRHSPRQLTFIEDTGTGFWFAATIFYCPDSFKDEAAMANDVLFFGMMVAVPDVE